MKQFFAQLKHFSVLSPARILAAMEGGAEWIHDLPYRFVRWLPRLPGLLRRGGQTAWHWFCRTETVQELLAIHAWMERKAEDIHQLPYRFARWLSAALSQCRSLWRHFSDWAKEKDMALRMKLFASLCMAGAVMTFTAYIIILAMQPVGLSQTTYLLVDGENDPRGIFGTADFDRELTGLTVADDSSARDAQLVLDAGQYVRVNVDGQTLWATTRRETVANLLRRLNVTCGERDMVVVETSRWSPVISIQYEYEEYWQTSVTTDFDIERKPNYLMRKGKEKVIKEGKEGGILLTYRDIYRHGEMETTMLAEMEVTDPVTQVVEYGTRVNEVSRSDRIKKVVYNADGSGYLLFKSGKTMTFSEKVTCNATAYSIGSWTASGLPTKVGHIAVDPKVFPYGTRFYIYTNDGYLVYGNAVAADCGSAIKGHKIDLWFETYDEACWFGRRDCTVFVLN